MQWEGDGIEPSEQRGTICGIDLQALRAGPDGKIGKHAASGCGDNPASAGEKHGTTTCLARSDSTRNQLSFCVKRPVLQGRLCLRMDGRGLTGCLLAMDATLDSGERNSGSGAAEDRRTAGGAR